MVRADGTGFEAYDQPVVLSVVSAEDSFGQQVEVEVYQVHIWGGQAEDGKEFSQLV